MDPKPHTIPDGPLDDEVPVVELDAEPDHEDFPWDAPWRGEGPQ